MKDQILYLFDPLCGWCFGFSKTIVEFRDQHPEIEFKAVPGGMITGSRVAPYHTMKDYISGARKRLEEMTGARFGKPYLDNIIASDIQMDSVPPSKALIAFESLGGNTIDFAHSLQRAHFVNGKDYNDKSIYLEIAAELGIDPAAYEKKYDSVETDLGTKEAFNWVQQAGVQGFPTVILHSQGQYYLIARGYMPLEGLNQNLQSAKNQLINS